MLRGLKLAIPGLMVFLATAAAVHADQINLGSASDAEIVATVALAHTLRANCEAAGGMDDATRDAVSRWERANHVDRVSAEIVRLAKEPATKAAVATLAQQVEDAAASVEPQSCAALVAILEVPSSSFAKRAALLPEVKRSDRASADAAKGRPKQPTQKERAGANASSASLAAQIEGFGFDNRPGFGFDGMVMLEIYPVVLFKDGRLLMDVTALGFENGLEAHQRENPNAWTRWKTVGGRVQILGGDTWRYLAFDAVYDKVPPGFGLTGRYDRMGGFGNVAIGGTDTVTTWESFEFWPGGRVTKGASVGADVTGLDYRVVAQSVSPDRRGRYAIDGITMTLTYDDGTSESLIMVTDPKNPSVIWLNGRGFVRHDPDD